jgi:hypothetical protein
MSADYSSDYASDYASGDADDDPLLTRGEVARLCRVDVRTVDRWLTAGKVDCHRTPSGRVLFRRRDVLTAVAVAQGQAAPRGRGR